MFRNDEPESDYSGSSEKLSCLNQSQAPKAGNNKDCEKRRNCAVCFVNPNRREDWHANYTGALVTEDLPAGTKLWVNVYERIDRKGRKYLSVVLKTAQPKGGTR